MSVHDLSWFEGVKSWIKACHLKVCSKDGLHYSWLLVLLCGHYLWRKSDMTCHCPGLSPSSELYISDCQGRKSKSAGPFQNDSHSLTHFPVISLWPLTDHPLLRPPKELSGYSPTGDLWPAFQSDAQQCAFHCLLWDWLLACLQQIQWNVCESDRRENYYSVWQLDWSEVNLLRK